MAKAKAPTDAVSKLVDELYTTRAKRYVIQHDATKLEEREKEIRKELIAALPKFGATGIAGKLARAQLETKTIKRIENWETFCKFVAKTKSWDLLQRRVSDAAIQERWDSKKAVAGVKPETVTVVSLHKV